MKKENLFVDYTPFWGINLKNKSKEGWELVCFLCPTCSGTCAHCWSADTFLGHPVPISWHKIFWKQIDYSQIQEIKLTGGEPFFFQKIGELIDIIHSSAKTPPLIKIFTSGQPFISLLDSPKGSIDTTNFFLKRGVVKKNVEIHLSADEQHAGSLYRMQKGITSFSNNSEKKIQRMNQLGIPLLQRQVKNFLAACNILEKEFVFFGGGKLKVHAATGRFKYHRKVFGWIDEKTWKEKVIATEGLVKAGNARKFSKIFPKAFKPFPVLSPSLFILPGAEFYQSPFTQFAQSYFDPEKKQKIFLDLGREKGKGASLLGWQNLINKVFCGGSAFDSLDLINNKKRCSKI